MTLSGFGAAQLAKFGWSKGEGLGKDKTGITKALVVSKKTDSKGVGANNGSYDFAWWDHIYNKSAVNIQVDTKCGSVQIQTGQKIDVATEKHGAAPIVSNKDNSDDGDAIGDSSSLETAAPGLGSMFVKSSNTVTATNLVHNSTSDGHGKRRRSETATNERRDYSVNLTDQELFLACGGSVAAKGARGRQTGKLRRVDPDKLLDQGTSTESSLKVASIIHVKSLGNGNEVTAKSQSKDRASKKKSKDKKEKKIKKDKKPKKEKRKKDKTEL